MANPSVILIALCLGLQLGVSQVAFAQGSYPSRPITIINPFPRGRARAHGATRRAAGH
jgi:tripartite-type tricarboxylate transporter receptor subunit TctC